MKNQNHKQSIDFIQTAQRVLRENGFDPEFGSAVEAQTTTSKQPARADGVNDLRNLLWSSIDNTESRDLDQLEVAEELSGGAIRILVAVADVDALIGSEDRPPTCTRRRIQPSVHGRAGLQCSRAVLDQPHVAQRKRGRVAAFHQNIVAPNGDVTKFDVYRAAA